LFFFQSALFVARLVAQNNVCCSTLENIPK